MTPAAILSILVRAQGVQAATAQINGLDRAAARAGASSDALGKRMKGLGGKIKSTGADLSVMSGALIGIGVEAGRMSSKFNAAMEMVHTQAGASQKEVNKLKGEVLNLAKGAKQGPVELADALYRLEGAGLRGQKAMKALKAASDLAAVGNADVEDTAKTLSQAWFSGIRGAKNFKKVVAEMNATVGAGDLRMQNLVDALGTGILPVAHQAGLKLRDITGVLATFGDETKNVDGWAAQFSTALHYLYAPTTKAEKALQGIGLSGSKLGKDMRGSGGLLSALKDLRSHLGALSGGPRGLKASQVLSNILPGGRGRVLAVLLNQLGRYQQKLKQIGGTTKNFGDAVSKTQQTAAFKISNAWSKVQVSLVKLGDALLPVVVPIFQKLAKFVGTLGDKFSALSPHTKKLVVIGGLIAAALGPVLVIFGGLVIALGAILSPIALAVAAIAGLAGGFVYAYTTSDKFQQIVQQVVTFLAKSAGDVKAFWDSLSLPLKIGLAAGLLAMVSPVLAIGAAFVLAYTKSAGFRAFIQAIPGTVKAAFDAVVGWVKGAVSAVITEVKQWDTLASVVSRIFGLMVGAARLLFDELKLIFKAGLLLLGPIVVAGWTAIKDIFSGAWTAIKGIVSGGFTVLRGIVKIIGGLFKGDFHQVWEGVKDIFRGELQAVKGILSGAWQILKAPVDAVTAGLHDAFANSWDRIKGVFKSGVNTVIDFLNVLIKAINFIPGVPDIKTIPHIGAGGGNPVAANTKAAAGQKNLGQTGHLAHGGAFARTGGFVNRPMTFMGEEAPSHPEFVIPTNPAYRKRAVGLLGQAAKAVGFASGGVYGKGQLESLWTGAGGPSSLANVAAAIALAESGGRVGAHNPSGATGLWQILGQVVPGNLFSPSVNAANAVSKWRSAHGFSPWVTYTNGAYKQFLGGGGGVLGAIGHAVGSAITSVGDVLGKFPSANGLGMFKGLGSYVLGKAKAFAKGKIGSLLGGGAQGKPGGGGLGTFDGLPVANWIVPILNWARQHGWGGHITSGYRDPSEIIHSAIVAPQGKSNHNFTAYPGGAIDVGSPADRVDGQLLASVLAGYKGARRLVWGGPVIGDWGHFSATGHKTGGVWGRALGQTPGYATGTGGAKPGLAWVGERGPELVRFVGGETVFPHAASMMMVGGGIPGYAKGAGAKKAFNKSQAASRTAAANALATARSRAQGSAVHQSKVTKGFGGTAANPTYNGWPISLLLKTLGLPVGNALQNRIRLQDYLKQSPGVFTGPQGAAVGPLKGARDTSGQDPNQPLIDATNALAALEQQRIDLDTQVQANQKAILALANQGPEIVAAVVAAVNGGIGGKVGLGFSTPGFAGGVARYGSGVRSQ